MKKSEIYLYPPPQIYSKIQQHFTVKFCKPAWNIFAKYVRLAFELRVFFLQLNSSKRNRFYMKFQILLRINFLSKREKYLNSWFEILKHAILTLHTLLCWQINIFIYRHNQLYPWVRELKYPFHFLIYASWWKK